MLRLQFSFFYGPMPRRHVDHDAFFIWYLTVLAIGTLYLPLSMLLFRDWNDRGWLFSKSLGLVTGGYVLWVCNTLHLKGVKVLKDRSEELGADKAHREQYDAATARAVAVMPVLCEYLLPLVKVGGKMLAMKGETAPEEVQTASAAIKKLGGAEPALTEVSLPGVEGRRWLVSVPKMANTPAGYPRRTGLPLKKPIS